MDEIKRNEFYLANLQKLHELGDISYQEFKHHATINDFHLFYLKNPIYHVKKNPGDQYTFEDGFSDLFIIKYHHIIAQNIINTTTNLNEILEKFNTLKCTMSKDEENTTYDFTTDQYIKFVNDHKKRKRMINYMLIPYCSTKYYREFNILKDVIKENKSILPHEIIILIMIQLTEYKINKITTPGKGPWMSIK